MKYTAAAVAEPFANAAGVPALFAAMQARRWQVATQPLHARRASLLRFKAALLAHRAAFHAAFAADFGKPSVEVEMTEIQPVLAEIDHAVAHLEAWARARPAGVPLLLAFGRGERRFEPKGVVLILAPWNFPVLLLFSPLVAALAAGNCVIVRPSEKTPRVAAVMASVVAEAFPAGEVALVGGEPDVAEALLTLPFDHIFFTGSGAVGRKVMRAAAEHLTPVTLELGGKSPAFVDPSADMAQAACRLVWGRMLNAGQACVSPDYALVDAACYPAFLEAAVAAATQFYGATEAARLHSPAISQIIDTPAFERLRGLLAAALAAGARPLIGGSSDPAQRRIAPTILADVAPDNPIMAAEIFGPILPVLRYRTLDEAIALVRANDKPLALYIFSQNRAITERVLRETSAGGTVVNNTIVHLGNPNLPFGGVGPSGMGSYHGESGFRTFSHERSVMFQHRIALTALVLPPYRRWSDLVARASGLLLYGLLPRLRGLLRRG